MLWAALLSGLCQTGWCEAGDGPLTYLCEACLVLGQAVTVGVTMYVLSISELSEVQMVTWSSLTIDVSSNWKLSSVSLCPDMSRIDLFLVEFYLS